ncbi:MAG: SpoIID/LytB domain-containing protein [Gemmatimonadaceae bacterium]|nr:SpoIID/LytB domain-containing protein [Gemmatimonadaceae bacterium]
MARPGGDTFLRFGGKRYRGELVFTATDSGVLVVNRVPVEDYLRGVVPMELPARNPAERAALEAQAIAARSYAYIRVPGSMVEEPLSGFNLVATVQNQVYGGADAEHPLVNEAIDRTAGQVLRYNGLIVDAPYSSSCGGRTATPAEAWRGVREEPYLQSVDDTDPRTGKPYCDLSPRNHWQADFDEAQLRDVVRLRGAGNGHGVGMCQWGAIGRARAGADAREILRHYYPGTVVGFAD